MFKKIRKTVSNLIYKTENTMSLPNQFRRFGNREYMTPDWTKVLMSDEDLYTGYSYAAIRNRANSTSRVAISNVETESKKEEYTHPYLELINNSTEFSQYSFWNNISTYLDLEGIYYLMAIRTKKGKRMGDITSLKLLNPYNIKRVLSPDNLKVAGYIENREGSIREIPVEMIIEIKELNPFSYKTPYAMTDAAKEYQFTLKTTGDFTRHALKHNINAPGLLSTSVILPDKDFQNFTERVRNHTKGEPIFGNGKGAITWDNMNIQLSKAALKDVNEMNRETLMSVAGVSKTILGIEQSGVTRETGKVQRDLLVSNQTMPRVQLIIDALNLDYKTNYLADYFQTGALIILNNPLEVDHDSDIKATEAKQKEADLYDDLIKKGYPQKLVSEYIKGTITIDELGEPKIEIEDDDDENSDDEKEKILEHLHSETCFCNEVDSISQEQGIVTQQQGALQNAIVDIEQRMLLQSINKINKQKNSITIDSEKDVLNKRDKNKFINELEMILIGFFGIVFTFQSRKTMRKRAGVYGLLGLFKMNNEIKRYIKKIALKGAVSHIDTISKDMYETAKQQALKGLGIDAVTKALKDKYTNVISTTRAKTIARTETNRAFSMAQFEADKQFVKQNKLSDRAFKVWKTRSGNPCPICQQLEDEGPIPFSQPFRAVGQSVKTSSGTFDINYESLQAGNAHPNCACIYELIIKEPNNQLSDKIISLNEELNKTEEKMSEMTEKITLADQILKELDETV